MGWHRRFNRSYSGQLVTLVIHVLQLTMSTKQTSLRLSPSLERALNAYRDSLTVPPSKTAVIAKALADFLAKEGFLTSEEAEQEQPSRS